MSAPHRDTVDGDLEQALSALGIELQARTAEAEWLKSHYEEQLRAAFAQIASLQARLRSQDSAAPNATPSAETQQQIERLKLEITRLSAGESRYLDRIEELKEALLGER